MTKQTAIRKFCLECGGGHKDVALCTDPSCFLWPYRLGCGPKSSGAKEIMARIRAKYPKDVEKLVEYGLEPSIFFPPEASYKPKKRVGSILGRPSRENSPPRQAKAE